MTITHTPAPTNKRSLLLRRLILLSLLVGAAAATACSTTEGFGKDVKHLGGGIENSAAKNK